MISDYMPPVTPGQLAAELKALRVRRGFTQPELAARMKKDVSTITHIERATRQPGLDVLFAWLDVCGGILVVVDEAGVEDALLGLREPHRSVARASLTLDDDDARLLLRLARVIRAVPGAMKQGVVAGLEQLAGVAGK